MSDPTTSPEPAPDAGTDEESLLPAAPPEPTPKGESDGAQRPALHLRISTQLYSGIFSVLALTIVASVVSWISFTNVDRTQREVTNESVPELVSAFGLAELSTALVAAAPRLTVSPPEQFPTVAGEVVSTQQEFEAFFVPLAIQNPGDPHIVGIRQAANQLRANIATITADMPRYYSLSNQIESLQDPDEEEGIPALYSVANNILLPAIDDQLFFQVTGYRDFQSDPVDLATRTSGEELLLSRHLNSLQADIAQVTELMGSAFIASDAAFVEPLRESFESTRDRINISLDSVSGLEVVDELEASVQKLLELGSGDDSAFQATVDRLAIVERQNYLLTQNQEVASQLLDEVQTLVERAQSGAELATDDSSQTINRARVLLVIISVIGVIGAALISWLFVGRILLRRIGRLSGRMRTLAQGDLEEEVEVVGRDEVAEMASALEVFRRHALEIQRLNLVEELAQELSERNDELQSVLEELGQAQDQIVAREKLAALGEVTAGVAHEIRNPLNFINNFSEVSSELLEEMAEIIEEIAEGISDEQRALIEEIAQDLNSNLERIQGHGSRANRIVQDMLQMGRGGGETQPTNINDLIHEHSLLAFHSARAQDPDFQVNLTEDFDPEMGEMEVVPQDLGRVFLNFVSNAGYATNKKQKELIETNSLGDFMPTILLKTRRTEESAILSVRDNGSGIPPDVAAKIFDPFFTTKPTNEGTGLGLSLSNDIIREHGGTITVNSEPDKFTEMVVELPLTRPQDPGATGMLS